MNDLNLSSRRAKKARLARRLGPANAKIAGWLASLLIILAAVSATSHLSPHLSYLVLAVGLALAIVALWWRQDLSNLPPLKAPLGLDDLIEANLLGRLRPGHLSPADLWQAATSEWSGRFVLNHLLISTKAIEPTGDPKAVWQKALELNPGVIDGASLAVALILSSNQTQLLAALNLNEADVLETYNWQQRLRSYLSEIRPYYGGVGRDWASGFTPLLNQFGLNISRLIESGRAGLFDSLAHHDILNAITSNLIRSGGVALVGEAGSGKTSLGYALAQRLLEGKDPELSYYQIFSLDASTILAAGHNLERLLLNLFREAARAKNVIIFLDNANLFFGQGLGALDIGQLLSPLMQDRVVKLLVAFTPNDYQRFKVTNSGLAAGLSVVTVNPPPPAVTMKVLEDTALTIEPKDRLLISFQAIRQAYQLADQYISDQVFPGKAIKLLNESTAYAHDKIVTAESVSEAVEKSLGIKTARPAQPEADALLNLEDKIHQRMINQDRAVRAVSASLRRGRAGVASPNKPVGAFLFLGPTGVGKTELARSLAATYFGAEDQIIRLDMTEYAATDASKRLLDSAQASQDSLIMMIRTQPFSVVLLDEVEKASPEVLNLLLQLLDEGRLTDNNGQAANFKNAIIICTSNAGSADISAKVAGGQTLDNFEKPLIDKLIQGNVFKPELINRFDEVVLFRPLSEAELSQVVKLMLASVNKNLAKQNIAVELTDQAIAKVVSSGYDPQFGARPMRRAVQTMVEDVVANRILSGQAQPGSVVKLDSGDLGQP